jgi:hypothetical protein
MIPLYESGSFYDPIAFQHKHVVSLCAPALTTASTRLVAPLLKTEESRLTGVQATCPEKQNADR